MDDKRPNESEHFARVDVGRSLLCIGYHQWMIAGMGI